MLLRGSGVGVGTVSGASDKRGSIEDLSIRQSNSHSIPPPPLLLYASVDEEGRDPQIACNCLLVPVAVAFWWYWTRRAARRAWKSTRKLGIMLQQSSSSNNNDDAANNASSSPGRHGGGYYFGADDSSSVMSIEAGPPPPGCVEGDAYKTWEEVKERDEARANPSLRFVRWIRGADFVMSPPRRRSHGTAAAAAESFSCFPRQRRRSSNSSSNGTRAPRFPSVRAPEIWRSDRSSSRGAVGAAAATAHNSVLHPDEEGGGGEQQEWDTGGGNHEYYSFDESYEKSLFDHWDYIHGGFSESIEIMSCSDHHCSPILSAMNSNGGCAEGRSMAAIAPVPSDEDTIQITTEEILSRRNHGATAAGPSSPQHRGDDAGAVLHYHHCHHQRQPLDVAATTSLPTRRATPAATAACTATLQDHEIS